MKGKRDFIASGAVYTILGFLPTASRLFLYPLFLHYLTPQDFALISMNTVISTALTPFMSFGIEAAMNKYYFDFFKYPKIENAFFSTLVISVICFSFTIGFLFTLVGPRLFLYAFNSTPINFFPYGITGLLTAMPAGLNSLYLSYMRCRKDLKNYIILNLGLFILAVAGEMIAIMFFKMKVEQLVWVRPIITWMFIAVATAALLWKTGVHFEKRLVRLSLKYSIPLLPHLIFNAVFATADRLMIVWYLKDLTFLTIYNLALAVSGIIDTFEQALRNATFPNIFKLLKENVNTNVGAISRIHTINGFILMMIISGVALMTPVGDYYFLKPVYRPLLYFIPFALIISTTRFFYIVYAEPLFFFKKVGHVSISTFLQGIFAIVFCFLLIKPFGLMGVIFANILSKFIQLAYIYYTSLTIKIFRYKVGFILTGMFSMILILVCLTISSYHFIDNRIVMHLTAAIPLIFTSCFILHYFRKNNISLKQLW